MNKKIDLKTAFYWKRKILKVLTKKDDDNKLVGTIKTNEAFLKKVKRRNVRKRGCISYSYTNEKYTSKSFYNFRNKLLNFSFEYK